MKKTKDFILFFIFFFISLQSYFFKLINFAPFPPLGFLLVLFLNTNLKKKHLFILASILLVFTISILIGFINNNYYLYLPTILGSFLGPIFLFFFLNINFSSFNNIFLILKNVITIHLIFFYLQLLTYYVFGYKIDFLFFITGEFSRNEAFGVISEYFRPSGLFNEPATYSLFIFGFTLIYFWGIKKVNLLIIVTLLSLLFSFSASGIILFILMTFFILFEILTTKRFIVLILFTFTLYFILSYNFSDNIFVLYFQNRFENGLDSDGSTSQRFTNAFNIFSNSNYKDKMLGYGIGNTPVNLDTAVGSGISSHLISFGYLFNFFLFIIFIPLLKKIQYKYIFFFLILLTTSMTYNVLHYWLFFGLIILLSNFEKKIHSDFSK